MVLRLHRGVHGDARGAHVHPEQLASHVKNRVMLRASPRRFAPITSCGANAHAAALVPCVRHVICTITSCGDDEGLFSSSGAKVYVHKIYFRGVLFVRRRGVVLYARKFAKSYVKRYKHKVWLASSLRSRYGRLTAGPASPG